MPTRKLLMIGCGLLAVLFLGLAVIYFTRTAADLPAFLPGHQAGLARHHTKHGIAMLLLAALAGVGVWMFSGRQGSAERF